MSAYRVGLTGGLASGKSTVARRLAERGIRVIDADDLVADLYRPGGPGTEAVGTLFGPRVLAADGSVDKRILAQIAFDDPTARARLEAAIHPLVREHFRRIAEGVSGLVVLEATLLVEAGYAPDFDWIVSVEAPRELRLERATARGLTRADAAARLEAQGDGAARRAAAHEILLNDGGLERLVELADRLADSLKVRAARTLRAT